MSKQDMPPAPKGRGKGRGRGRSTDPQPSLASAAPAPQQPQVPRAAGRAAARRQPEDEVVRKVAQLSITTSSTTSGSVKSGNGNGNGSNGSNGNGRQPIGRGVVRHGVRVDVQPLVTRPQSTVSKKGVTGNSLNIITNFHSIGFRKELSLYKYHVDFKPEEDRRHVKKGIIYNHFKKEKYGDYLYDGTTIYTTHELCKKNKPLEFVEKRKSDDQEIKVTVQNVGTVVPSDYQYLQVLNILMREGLSKLNMEEMRRQFYDPDAKVTLSEFKLELWPGYITTIAQYENNILLQSELTFKVVRKDTAYDVLRRQKSEQRAFKKSIIGTIVMTKYNNKTYRVDDVSFSETPQSTFSTRSGPKSYIQYYKERYGINIGVTNQPLLISKSTERRKRSGDDEFVRLVPELCLMTGLNDELRGNFNLMRAIAQHTAVNPDVRINKLLQFNKRLTSHPAVREKFNNWGLQVGTELMTVRGRQLPAEDIYVSQTRMFSSGSTADWTKSLRSTPMLHSVPLRRWAVVFPSRVGREAQTWCETLQKLGRPMGFEVSAPKPQCIQGTNIGDYTHALEELLNNLNPEMVMIILTSDRPDIYSAVKRKLILDKPTPSQVMLSKNISSKSMMSIATKVLIQMNCKLGGAPWLLAFPVKKSMVIGFDVCHDPSDKRLSYGAMVSSMDSNITRYYSMTTQHETGQELSTNFGVCVRAAAERFAAHNDGALPEKILIYRDGVGEGQFQHVFEVEVRGIEHHLNNIYKEKNIPLKMAFIVVTKRINTRLMGTRDNVLPGTIVDDVITSPLRYDFFLVSQSVRQGTVSPTHYNVIYDTSDIKPDHLQRLTYKLTHLYYNCSATVAVPAPCQYAHKLAFLTANSVKAQHSNMDRLLYFL